MAQKSTIGRIVKWVSPWLSRAAPGFAAAVLARLFLTPLPRPVVARERPHLGTATVSSLPGPGGRSLRMYSWGAGPTVLLMHGWSGRASQLAHLSRPLTEAGFRVVAFDAPAHGASPGRVTSLPELAEAIERVVDEVGPLVALVAHSLGSAAATLAISRGLSVERAVYVAPPEDLPGYMGVLAEQLGFAPHVAARAQDRVERRVGIRMDDARGGSLATRLSVPLLAFHDARDRQVPIDEGRALVQAWPGARLVATEGLGHVRILWDDRVMQGIVDFIREGALRPAA